MTRMPRGAQVLLVVYLLLAVLEQVAGIWHRPVLDAVLLALLMPVLAVFVLRARTGHGRLTTLAVLALTSSWLGDTVGGAGLLIKIGLFLIAQGIYVVAFWPFRRRSVMYRPLLLVFYLVGLGFAVALAARMAGSFLPAVLVYGCALGLMAVLASGLNPMTLVGGILFVISDLSLAIGLFDTGRLARTLDLLVMPTYLVAQFLLGWGMVIAQATADADEAGSTPPHSALGRSADAVTADG